MVDGAKLEAVEGGMWSFLFRVRKGGAVSSLLHFLSSKFICSFLCSVWFILSFVFCRVSKSPRSADHSLSPRYNFLYLWLPTHRIALVEYLGYCAGDQVQSASHSPIRGVTRGIFSIKLLYFLNFSLLFVIDYMCFLLLLLLSLT